MKKVTVNFNMSTKYVGSTQQEEMTYEFYDDETEQEIKDFLTEAYTEWVLETIYGGWHITNTEEIPDEE